MKDNNTKIIGTCFIGWAGSGKSYIASKLAQELDVDFVGEYKVDKAINQNIPNPKLDKYFLELKEETEIERLRLHREFDVPFISDLHFGGIYRVFNRLHNTDKKSYDEIYRFISENTPKNVQNLGLEISSEQTLKNLMQREENQSIKGLVNKMVPLMDGLFDYLVQHNLPNFSVIDTSYWNPFDASSFIQKYGEVLPQK